jgi:integrase
MLADNGHKVNQRFNYHMSTEEVKTLFRYSSRWSFKWQLLLSLCAFRGLRVSEALAVNYLTDFVDEGFSKIIVREAKTNKIRTLPLIRPLSLMINKYVALEAHRLRNGFLFPYYSSKKLPFMDACTAGAYLCKMRKIIGKDHPGFLEKYHFIGPSGRAYYRHRVSYHSLRRWFETTIFNRTESAYIVKEIMDYTDFKVLNSYLNTASIKEREGELLSETFNPIMDDFKNDLLGQTKLGVFV